MTNEEYAVLKKWHEMHPKQKMSAPTQPTEIMQKLIDAGFMTTITRPDASNHYEAVVVGYDVTTAGENALEQHRKN